MCVTVVQWSRSCLHVQINRVRLPATLFSVSLSYLLFCFVFFSVWSPFLNTIFPFGLFSFTLTADHAGHALGSIYIFSISAKFYFGKWFSKALDLHTGPNLRPEKKKQKIEAVKTCPSSETAEFISVLVKLTFCTLS